MQTLLLRLLPTLTVLLGSWLLVGCASTSGGVQTLKQLQLNVGWKLTAYNEAATTGGVTTGQAQRVAAARKAYEEAFQQALKNANENLDAPTPANVQQRANQLIEVIAAVLATTT